MQKRQNEMFGYLLIFITGVLWGTIGIFVKEMAKCGIDALTISFLRVALAFVVMLVVTIARSGLHAFRIDKKSLLFSALLGIVCQGIYNIFYSYAVVLTGVSISAVLLNVAPAFTMIVSVLLFSEKLTSWKVLALLINIIGCTLTVTGGKFSIETMSVMGILCGIGAGICYAMTAIFGKFAMAEADSFVISTYSYFFAALLLFVPARPWTMQVDSKLLHIIVIGLLLAIVPTAFAYVLYYIGLTFITETSKVPIVASAEPIVGTVLGVMLYHEHIDAVSVVGILLVLTSIVLMNKKAEKKVSYSQ
ncbi:MAG: DMT family transporter [Eubacteriales bacterium]|nr:DMT family transporter [Eubacteriales bacterium]